MQYLRQVKMKNVVVFFLILAVFFVPMGANGISISVGFGRISLFRFFLIGAIAAQMLRMGFLDRGFVIWRKKSKYSILFLLIWFSYAFLSILWAADYSGFLKILWFLFVGISLTLLFTDTCEQSDIDNIVFSFSLGVMLQAIIGWYEVFTRDYRFISGYNFDFYVSYSSRIPIAMLSNPNDFATLMFLGVLFSYYLIYTEKYRKIKLLVLLFLVNDVIMIVLSQSRSVLFGLLIAVLILLWLKTKYAGKIAMFLAAMLTLVYPATRHWLLSKIDLNYFTTKGESASVRINLIRNGLLFLGKTYGFGVGNGQIESWMSRRAVYDTHNITNMHNWWFEILTAYGIIIGAGFVILYLKLIIDFYKIYCVNKYDNNGKRAMIICALLGGYFLACMSSSSNMSKEYIWLFWAVCIALQGNMVANNRVKDPESNDLQYSVIGQKVKWRYFR